MPVQQPASLVDADVDWARVAASDARFYYIDANEGELKNVRVPENCEGAKAARLIRGAYHFFRPDKCAEAQAESFLHVRPPCRPETCRRCWISKAARRKNHLQCGVTCRRNKRSQLRVEINTREGTT